MPERHLLLYWTGHEPAQLDHMMQDSPTAEFDSTNSVEPSFIASGANRDANPSRIADINPTHVNSPPFVHR
jgi:hypothetical protein